VEDQHVVRLGGGEDRSVRPFGQPPRMVGMAMGNDDRVGANRREHSLPVLAEVAKQAEAVLLDRES